MGKIILILKREFLLRVRKTSFMVMTLLGPFFFGLILILPAWLSFSTLGEQQAIMVFDKTDRIKPHLSKNEPVLISKISREKSFQDAFIEFERASSNALLYLNSDNVPILYLKEPINKSLEIWINQLVHEAVIERYLTERSFKPEDIRVLLEKPSLKVEKLFEENQDPSSFISGISILLGIIIYVFILTYTMQVIKGVTEEKSNRISELLLTAVKPFQLMLGKILGIGLVSVFQFLLWLSLAIGISSLVSHRYGDSLSLFSNQNIEETLKSEGIDVQQALEWNQIVSSFEDIDVLYIGGLFLFYFIFGYLFYSALFASIGAATDSETDTQQFIFPFTMPILLCFAIFQIFASQPEGAVSTFFLLFPFTSPVAVMMLLPFGIAFETILLSMFILVLSFLGMVWIAGRIYGIGILTYGKKPSLKEIGKWVLKGDK